MSWLTDMAGKAENFLNHIDQNAAIVVKEFEDSSKRTRGEHQQQQQQQQQQEQQQEQHGLTEVVVNSDLHNNTSSHESNGHDQGSLLKNKPIKGINKAQTKDRDEELLQFLNSSADSPTNGNSSTPPQGTSTPNNTSSVASRRNSHSSLIGTGTEMLKGFLTPANNHNHNHHETGHNGVDGPTSENAMLRNEIASLSQEMNQVLIRAKTAEKALLEARNECLRLSRENRDHEKRQQASEQALIANEKLKELEAVQKLEHAHKELEEMKEKYEEVQKNAVEAGNKSENELGDLRKEIEQVREESLRKELSTAETIKSLELERSRLRSLTETNQNENRIRIRKMEEYRQNANTLKEELNTARKQHDEYKLKAKKVLAEKEKIISSLRNRKTKKKEDNTGDSDDNGDEGFHDDAELQQAKRERDLLRDETVHLSDQLSATKHELSEMERQIEEQNELSRKFQNDAATAVGEMRLKWEESEQEILRINEELRYLQEASTRQKTNFMATLKEKDEELDSARAEINQLTSSTSEDDLQTTSKVTDLENRLRQMTDSILQKQALLEAVKAEKTSLVLQNERLERDNQELSFNGGRSLNSRYASGDYSGHNSNNHHNAHNTPMFLQESPFDNKMARGVKKAYSTLDKFSGRIGSTLRRYPMARIFVLAYMTLLHFWVFLILFQAAPDPTKR